MSTASPPAVINAPKLSLDQLLMAIAAENAPPKPVPHAPPKLPPGVVPTGAKFALDDAGSLGQTYSWLNNSTYCGMGFPGYTYLAELQQRSEYRAPVETIANELCRKWIQFKGADEEKLKELTTAFEEFAVREKFRLAAIHDGGQGRGQIFIDIKGQDSPEAKAMPLKIDEKTISKGDLVGFQNIEPMWSTPYAYNSNDPTQPNFYRPEKWYVMGSPVHSDRLLTFIARPVPDILKPSYNFGGLSLTQLIQPYVVRWLKTVDSVNRLISNFSMIYLKTDMEGTLAGDSEANSSLMARLRVFSALRDNRGVVAIDKDSEEFEQIAVPLSGLAELQAQAQEHMAAPTHIPLVFLTGITPSGLNASSDGEIKVFYNWIAGEQENFFEGNLRVVLELIQLHLWGKIDDAISFEWVPLDAPTTKELGEIRKADADAGVAYVGAGVISPDEERERLRNDPDSGYTSLEGDAPAPPLEQGAELDEEGKQADHERGQEDAEAAHERALELMDKEAKKNPKGAADGFTGMLLRMFGMDAQKRDSLGRFGEGVESREVIFQKLYDHQQRLENDVKSAEAALEPFNKMRSAGSSIVGGLIPDEVKRSAEYKAAQENFQRSFNRLREFNSRFTNDFKKELSAKRQAIREADLAARNAAKSD